jgi:hypothetical protein
MYNVHLNTQYFSQNLEHFTCRPDHIINFFQMTVYESRYVIKNFSLYFEFIFPLSCYPFLICLNCLICLSLYLSVSFSVCVFICLCLYLPVSLSVCLFNCLYLYSSFSVSVYLFVYLSVSLSVCLFIYL